MTMCEKNQVCFFVLGVDDFLKMLEAFLVNASLDVCKASSPLRACHVAEGINLGRVQP